jgi:dephospho-CoA kinase
MQIIGLTGGIASGKSTASSILKSFGAKIIDADILARKVVEKGQPALDRIVNTFGTKILNNQGELNRSVLGEIVFNNQEKLKKLNQIIHPAVNILAISLFEKERNNGMEKIVYDCPLLIEENLLHLVDKVWLIYINEETQLKRLMERDNFTKEQAMKRINNQMPLKEKIIFADILIDNSGSINDLEKKLKNHWYK